MNPERIWPVTQAVAVLMVLGFFLVALQPILSPFLLYLVLLALLLPNRGFREHPLVVMVATVLTLLWLLLSTGSLMAPFLVAMGLAYLLDPAVDKLQARGLGRTLSIGILMVPVLVGLVFLFFVGLPALGGQVVEVIRGLPVMLGRLADWAMEMELELERIPLIGPALQEYVTDLDPQGLVAFLEERRAELARQAWTGVLGVGRGLGAALSILGYVVLTPVIAFYLLRDWDRVVARVADLVPRPRLAAMGGFFKDLDELLGRFLRGQITVAVLMGALTALGLWAWGFPFAFLIGAVVTVFSVVPYLGLVLSLLPAVLVALTSGEVGMSLVKVAVVFGVVQGLEGTVISPRIVGDSVGLHPVWIILAIAAGGFFFGFVGLLLAVPAASAVKLLVLRGVDRYKASEHYLGQAGSEAG